MIFFAIDSKGVLSDVCNTEQKTNYINDDHLMRMCYHINLHIFRGVVLFSNGYLERVAISLKSFEHGFIHIYVNNTTRQGGINIFNKLRGMGSPPRILEAILYRT